MDTFWPKGRKSLISFGAEWAGDFEKATEDLCVVNSLGVHVRPSLKEHGLTIGLETRWMQREVPNCPPLRVGGAKDGRTGLLANLRLGEVGGMIWVVMFCPSEFPSCATCWEAKVFIFVEGWLGGGGSRSSQHKQCRQ